MIILTKMKYKELIDRLNSVEKTTIKIGYRLKQIESDLKCINDQPAYQHYTKRFNEVK